MAYDENDRRNKRDGRSRKAQNRGICQCLPKLGISLILIPCGLAGFVLGLWLKSQNLAQSSMNLALYPGQIMLRAMFMAMVPLLFLGIVFGVANVRKGRDSGMICVTVILFLSLSTLSAVLGALAGHIIRPGRSMNDELPVNQSSSQRSPEIILNAVLNLAWNSVPNNMIEATFSKERPLLSINTSDNASSPTRIETVKQSGSNYIGLIVVSILFGCALARAGERGEKLQQLIEEAYNSTMTISMYFVRLLPFAMFFWMMREGLIMTAPEQFLSVMGIFLATTLGCIAIHQLILLPLLYLLIVRKNPIIFHLNLMPAILTAFGSASSIATLPVTIRCSENGNRLHQSVVRFVLPFGMVAHMNGGTFYVVLAAIFLAQLEGVTLGIVDTVLLCLTSIVLFIATSGTPSHGNPGNVMTALAVVGITQPQFLSLYISIDWIMERFRTAMNIVSDCYVAAFVEKLCEDNLPEDHRDSIQFETPLIDGYDHPPPANICRTCGHQIA